MILSTHGIVGSQIQSFVGLLDTYPNAAAAYSLRKLRSAYTGNAIRVRRSSDNTETNIGFSSSFGLDTTTLSSFCSGTNGFVTTWYDQSGNGRNATQTTAANQPQIVSSGSVLTLTGLGSAKPILRFDGINDSLNFTDITVSEFTSFYPSKKPTDSDLSAWFTVRNTGFSPYSPIIFGAAGIFISNGLFQSNANYNNNNYILMSGYWTSSNVGFIQVNNSNIALSNITASGGVIFNSINNRFNSNFSKCDVPEMILYSSDNSSNLSAINTNINTYYGIY
jgi:hypothetical protein